jgi:hypothetical protein
MCFGVGGEDPVWDVYRRDRFNHRALANIAWSPKTFIDPPLAHFHSGFMRDLKRYNSLWAKYAGIFFPRHRDTAAERTSQRLSGCVVAHSRAAIIAAKTVKASSLLGGGDRCFGERGFGAAIAAELIFCIEMITANSAAI